MVSKGLAGVLEHAAARPKRGTEITSPASVGRWNMTTWVSYSPGVCPADRGFAPRVLVAASLLLATGPLVWPARASTPDAGTFENRTAADAGGAAHFAIATENEASARAALEVMKQGGNAVDGAI